MAEELRFFLRVAVYSAGVGAIYWFVSYDAAGTALLVFAAVAGAVFVGHAALHVPAARNRIVPETGSGAARAWGAVNRVAGFEDAEGTTAEQPLAAGPEPIPTLSPWPIVGGVAVLMVGLGLIYGPWILLPGVALSGLVVWGWLTQLDPPRPVRPMVRQPASSAARQRVPLRTAPRFFRSSRNAGSDAEPGDVLLFHARGRVSRLGRAISGRSRWHHAGFAVGNGLMAEATPRGVSLSWIRLSDDEVTVASPAYPDDAVREQAIAYARASEGRREGRPGTLVAEILERSGFDIGKSAGSVSPGDLAEAIGLPRR